MPRTVEVDVSLELVPVDDDDGDSDGEVGNVVAWVTDTDNQPVDATLSVVAVEGSVSRSADTHHISGKAVIEGVPIQPYTMTITAEYPDDPEMTYETWKRDAGPGTDLPFTR